jgi:hypothetical protein
MLCGIRRVQRDKENGKQNRNHEKGITEAPASIVRSLPEAKLEKQRGERRKEQRGIEAMYEKDDHRPSGPHNEPFPCLETRGVTFDQFRPRNQQKGVASWCFKVAAEVD